MALNVYESEVNDSGPEQSGEHFNYKKKETPGAPSNNQRNNTAQVTLRQNCKGDLW